MHIYKHDSSVRLPDVPHINFAAAGTSRPTGGHPQSNESPSPLSGDREFSRLSSQLSAYPDVRAELVAQAKVAVSQGEYLTRRAAEETAAKFLGMETPPVD